MRRLGTTVRVLSSAAVGVPLASAATTSCPMVRAGLPPSRTVIGPVAASVVRLRVHLLVVLAPGSRCSVLMPSHRRGVGTGLFLRLGRIRATRTVGVGTATHGVGATFVGGTSGTR